MKKDIMIYLSSSALNALLPFLLIPVLTRYLQPEEYATIGVFISLSSIISVFTGMGLSGAIRVNFYKLNASDFKSYVSSTFFIYGVSSLLVLFLLLFSSDNLSKLFHVSPHLIILATVYSITQYLIQVSLVFFQVNRKPYTYGLNQIALTSLNFIISIFFVVRLLDGADGRINGILFSSIIFYFVYTYYFYTQGIKISLISRKHVISALNYALPLLPHTLILGIIPIADRLILVNQAGLFSAGLFYFSYQLAMPIGLIANSVNLAYMPYCLKQMRRGNEDRVVSTTYILMLCIIIVALFYSLVINSLMHFIAPIEYRNNTIVIYILVLSNVFKGLYLLVAKSFTYTEKIKQLSIVTVPLGILYILLIWSIAGEYKELGVAISILIYNLLLFVLTWVFANKIYPQPWMDMKKILPLVRKILLGSMSKT